METPELHDASRRSHFVIVPAFNEVRVIRRTVAPLIEAGFSVVVIDDGSTDGTWAALQDLPVYALRHVINLGQGAALQTGMTFALQQGAEYVIHFDGDGQHQLADLNGLLAPLFEGTAEVALGSRFLRRSSVAAIPFSRRITLRVARYINYLLTGVLLTDAHNGMRAITRHAAQRIRLRQKGYAHASEILSQIRAHRLPYAERPTTVRYSDYATRKGQSAWNGVNIVTDMLLTRVLP